MNKELLLKRLKSFAWRLLGMGIAAGLAFVSSNLDVVNLPAEAVVLIGLVIGELSKIVNTAFDLEGKVGRALGMKK